MLPHYLVKIFGTRNCHVHEMNETIWREKLKLSFQPFKKYSLKKYCLEMIALFNWLTKIFSQCAYSTTHRMIDYTHRRHQRHRKLLLLTIINVQSTFLSAILPNVHRFKKFFTGRLVNKVVIIRLLKISPHLRCIATLRCDLSSITALLWECRLFFGHWCLATRCSVATHIRSDWIFNNSFVANFLQNLSVKIFRKSVKVWRSYSRAFGVSLFMGHSVEQQRLWHQSSARKLRRGEQQTPTQPTIKSSFRTAAHFWRMYIWRRWNKQPVKIAVL